MARHSRALARRRAVRPLALVGLLGGGVAVTVGGIGLDGVVHGPPSASPPTSAVVPSGGPATTSGVPAQAPVPVTTTSAATNPVALLIPSIKVNTTMELLGVAADGTLQTPADAERTGWFTGSSLPGEPGPVVIAGHVDSFTGPAVFARLKDIRVGDPVTVALSDGRRVEYRVTSVVTYAKDKFPTEAVYGPRPDSELRLITCGGAFVKGQYVANVIVFGQLKA